tara:strand:+ start:869 stop:1879 length:1011 start_codon:yes stop_codon:yes gene_type:complete
LCGKCVVEEEEEKKQTNKKEKFYFSSFVFIKDDDESGVVNISGGEQTKKMMTMMSPLKALQSQTCRYCSSSSSSFSSSFRAARKLKKMKTCATRQLLRCSGNNEENDERTKTKTNKNSKNKNTITNNDDIRLDIRVTDVQLILGEMSLLWILELISRAVQVSISPDFPGWLAPIESPTPNSIASMISATAWNFTWIGFSAMLGAYELSEDDYPVVEKGPKTPTMKALEKVCLTMLLYAPAQAFGDAFSLHANLLNLAATPPLLIRLPTTFAFIFAFRFYVLCHRGEVNREIEESEFQLLYATLSVSLLATLCGAITQTSNPQFHIELAREIFQIVE